MMNTRTHFLGNIKLIFEHGVRCSKNKSRLMRLLAIHELHYVVEQILRERASESGVEKVQQDVFSEILRKLHRNKNIPEKDSLVLLNDDRNRAEHANKIPPYEEVQHYVIIVQNFLRWSYENYFESDFDLIMLEDQIIDKPIRRVMTWSRNFIKEGNLKSASARMYEGLGAFKFVMFGYLTEHKISKQMLEKQNISIDLADVLATLAFKIILADDVDALKKISQVKTNYFDTGIGVISQYPVPEFRNKEEAENDHEEILNIILTFQDRIPSEAWRHTDSNENLEPS